MPLPETFGRYTLYEKLAQGGMAEVFLAQYEGAQGFLKTVAIKRILPTWLDDPQFVGMLIDEAHLLTHLQHQNIVQVYELGKEGEAYFIAMEFVAGMDGRTLQQKLRARQIALPETHSLYILIEVLKALSFAHTRVDANGRSLEIVHRDISPQNILLSFHGEVKVADFGIAKGVHRQQTQAAQIKGKYAYMAPEQAMGLTVDGRADVFATGVVLYELLSGERCFDGPNEAAIIERVTHAALPNGWERRFAPALRAILRRALACAVSQRYPTAHALLEELIRYATMHRLVIHAWEFAESLRQLFPSEAAIAAARGAGARRPAASRSGTEQTAIYGRSVRSPIRRRMGWSILFRSGQRVLLMVIAGVGLFSVAAVQGDRLTPVIPATPIPVTRGNLSSEHGGGEGGHAPLADGAPGRMTWRAPVREEETRHPLPMTPPSTPTMEVVHQPIEPGTLDVEARPWGAVTIPGIVRGRETPVQVRLAAGTYTIQVRYAPTGHHLMAKTVIRPGTRTQCLASFTDRPTIRCR